MSYSKCHKRRIEDKTNGTTIPRRRIEEDAEGQEQPSEHPRSEMVRDINRKFLPRSKCGIGILAAIQKQLAEVGSR